MSTPAQNLDRPYRGLNSFTERDAPYFFGRSRETNLIVDNLLAYRLTILFGTSGIGKSSILQAGALPALRGLASHQLTKTNAPKIILLIMREWHGDVVASLLQRLVLLMEELAQQLDLQTPLPAVDSSLHKTLKNWATYFEENQLQSEYLIIFDQFEDYFRYYTTGDAFANEFAAILNDYNLPINFLVSIREDALAQLDSFKDLIPNLFNNRLRLLPLEDNRLQEVIRRPLVAYNEKNQSNFDIDDVLVTKIIEELKSSDRVDTSILQLVMSRLWDTAVAKQSSRLNLDTLKELGNIKAILRNYVESILEKYPPDTQATLSIVFDRLVSDSGTKFAQKVSDLESNTKLSQPELTSLLELLTQEGSRLLQPVEQGSEATYEILHDVLANPIRVWRNAFERDAQEQKRLEEERIKLEEEQREARSRLLARAIFALSIAFFVVLGFAYLAYSNFTVAESLRIANEEQARRNGWAATAYQSYLRGDPLLGLALALVANEGDTPIPVAERILSEIAYNSGIETRILVESGSITSSAASLDGSLLATGLLDGRVIVWNLDFGLELCALEEHDSRILGLAFNALGTLVLSYDLNNELYVWQADTCTVQGHISTAPFRVLAASFDADDAQLTLGTTENTLSFWDVATGTEIAPRLSLGSEPLSSLAFGLANQAIVGAVCVAQDSQSNLCNASDLILWDFTTESISQQFRTAANPALITALSMSQGQEALRIVSGSQDGSIFIWQPLSNWKQMLQAHRSQVNTISIDTSGRSFLSAGDDRSLMLWDLASGELLHRFEGHENSILNVQFIGSSDFFRAVSSSIDQTIFLWNLESGTIIRRFVQGEAAVTQIAFSPDGSKAVAGYNDGSAIIWDVATGLVFQSLAQRVTAVLSVDFSPNGNTVLIGDGAGYVVFYDVSTAEAIQEFQANPDKSITSLEFSPEGLQVAVGAFDGSVSLWDLESGTLIQNLMQHSKIVTGLKFLPDGNHLVSGSTDTLLLVWDINPDSPTYAQSQSLLGHTAPIIDIDISRAGNIVSADEAGFVYQWNLADGSKSQLQRLTSLVNSVAVTADGQVALASADESDLILMQNGQEFRLWQAFDTYESRTVSFSPDGKTALVGYSNGELILWRLDTLDELKEWTKANRFVRDFTCAEGEVYGLDLSNCDN